MWVGVEVCWGLGVMEYTQINTHVAADVMILGDPWKLCVCVCVSLCVCVCVCHCVCVIVLHARYERFNWLKG